VGIICILPGRWRKGRGREEGGKREGGYAEKHLHET